MNRKLKAGLITVGLAVWCAIVGFGIQFLSQYVTPTQISLGLIAVGLGLCFYTFYSLVLTKLEFDDKITELVDRK
jgi:hypothetical protein